MGGGNSKLRRVAFVDRATFAVYEFEVETKNLQQGVTLQMIIDILAAHLYLPPFNVQIPVGKALILYVMGKVYPPDTPLENLSIAVPVATTGAEIKLPAIVFNSSDPIENIFSFEIGDIQKRLTFEAASKKPAKFARCDSVLGGGGGGVQNTVC
jgi:hypothetical protein